MSRLLHDYSVIAICGYAQTGKTTIANEFFQDRDVIHTDDYIDCEDEINVSERCVVEGMHVFRMLRDEGFEPDVIVKLEPKFESRIMHLSQRKACDTIWDGWVSQEKDIPVICMNQDILSWFLRMEQAICG